MYEPKRHPNYLAILAVIIVGVTIGNLLSNWITSEILASRAEKYAQQAAKVIASQNEKSRQVADEQNRRAAAAASARAQAEIEQRRSSKDGSRLLQICNEWRKADLEMATYTTKSESAKHCARYDRYLQFGELPPRN